MAYKFSLDFDELEPLLDDLKKVGGNIEQATEKALIESHAYITPLIEKQLDKSKLPHGGKYSTVDRENSIKQIIREPNITWVGKQCSIDVGFHLDKTIVPIFLIRGGTAGPVKGLKSLLEGKKTQEEISEIQQDVLLKEIEKMW